jgi:hypothetical protein
MLNKMRRQSNNTGGNGFIGMLTVLFIGLKLTKYVDWSWTWVLSPIWIGFTIGVTFIVIGLMIESKK